LYFLGRINNTPDSRRQVTVRNIDSQPSRRRLNTSHNLGFSDFAQDADEFHQQMQQAMAESQRQSNAFFANPFGSIFGQGGGFF